MSRRLPRRERSLQMRTAFFTPWENVALSPFPTTSSSRLYFPVSMSLELTEVPFQSLFSRTYDDKSNDFDGFDLIKASV